MEREALTKKFEGILGPEGVISGREQLRTYERDSLAGYAAVPKLAVLPETAEQVQKVVKVCHDEGVPFVARGSGEPACHADDRDVRRGEAW